MTSCEMERTLTRRFVDKYCRRQFTCLVICKRTGTNAFAVELVVFFFLSLYGCVRYKVGQRPRGEPIGYMFRSAFRPYAFECACARMQGSSLFVLLFMFWSGLCLRSTRLLIAARFYGCKKQKWGVVVLSSGRGVVETVGEPP